MLCTCVFISVLFTTYINKICFFSVAFSAVNVFFRAVLSRGRSVICDARLQNASCCLCLGPLDNVVVPD